VERRPLAAYLSIVGRGREQLRHRTGEANTTGQESRGGGTGGRDPSWVERHLGPGWVEVEPGIYEFLLNEVRTVTELRVTVSPDQVDDPSDEGEGGPAP
jgi:hypothetical protein